MIPGQMIWPRFLNLAFPTRMFARPSLTLLALGLALLIHGPSQAQEASKPVGTTPLEKKNDGKAVADKATGTKAPAAKPAGDKSASDKQAPGKPSVKPAVPKPDGATKTDGGKAAGAKPAAAAASSPAGKPALKDGKPASTDKAPSKDGKTGAADKAASKDGKPALDKDGKPVVAKRGAVGPAVTRKNSLAALPLQTGDWKGGCGCRFYKPTDLKENGPLLLRLDDKKRATIRAEGTLEQMKLVDERHVQRKPPAIMAHDRMMLKFKGPTTTASFSGSAERNCAKFQDSCKSATYQGVLSLSQMGKQGSFQVWGVCGCQ